MDKQQEERAPALLVRRGDDAWNWTVVEADGSVVAEGVAADQDAAMQAAWGASSALAASGGMDYPNIIVGLE